MTTANALHQVFAHTVTRHSRRTAIVEPGKGEVSYAQLDALSDRLRDRLVALGVRPGDRVGLYLRKSIDSVAGIYGALKAGAAYVPVDPGAPPARDAYILADCAVRVLLIEERFVDGLQAAWDDAQPRPLLLVLPELGGGKGLEQALDAAGDAPRAEDAPPDSDQLAYILYTSGSTGKPKGVMLSHENAVSFVDWCSSVFAPDAEDRFSSHAPFHFDLSILDLHVALKHGAAVILIPDEQGKDPQYLARLMAEERITIWYSAPSILSLIAQFGNLDRHDTSALRILLFAGEVFPVKHLRRLCELLPRPRYFNLYGPTETNVCTYHEVVPPVPAERTAPYPIGRVCENLYGRVVSEDGRDVAPGEPGELVIAGPNVMQGYWHLPERTAQGFLVDANGTRWYRTGDIVEEGERGILTYRGRRDRMVKRRGYRVELGEIEAGLYQHPAVKEVAVVALPDEEAGVRIIAFLSCKEEKPPSLIAMKRFCSEKLPLYMIPDSIKWLEGGLPKTSTDKTDYQRLKDLA